MNGAINERIRAFVLKQFPLARKAKLDSDTAWLQSGLIDSLGILDLVHFLEEEFNIQVGDDELIPDNFSTLDAVSEFVRLKREGASKSAV